MNKFRSLLALLAFPLAFLLPKEDETTVKPEAIDEGPNYLRYHLNDGNIGWLPVLTTTATTTRFGYNSETGLFEAVVAKIGADPTQMPPLTDGFRTIQCIRRLVDGGYSVGGEVIGLRGDATFGRSIQTLVAAGYVGAEGVNFLATGMPADKKATVLVDATANYADDTIDASALVVEPEIGGKRVTEILPMSGNATFLAGKHAFQVVGGINMAIIAKAMETDGKLDGFITAIAGVQYTGNPLASLLTGFRNATVITDIGEKIDFAVDVDNTVRSAIGEELVHQVPLSANLHIGGTLAVLDVESSEVALRPVQDFGPLAVANWKSLLPSAMIGTEAPGKAPEVATPAS